MPCWKAKVYFRSDKPTARSPTTPIPAAVGMRSGFFSRGTHLISPFSSAFGSSGGGKGACSGGLSPGVPAFWTGIPALGFCTGAVVPVGTVSSENCGVGVPAGGEVVGGVNVCCVVVCCGGTYSWPVVVERHLGPVGPATDV